MENCIALVILAGITGSSVPTLQENEPVALMLVFATASKAEARLDDSLLLDAAFRHSVQLTDFRLEHLPFASSECGYQLRCLSQQARAAQKRQRSDLSFGNYMILVSRLESPGAPDLVSLHLIDVDRALSLPVDSDDIMQSILISLRPQLIEHESGLDTYFQDAFHRIGTVLNQHERRDLFGRIVMEPSHPRASISVFLDDRLVGETEQGAAIIKGVTPGSRHLSLRLQGDTIFTQQVAVRSGETTHVHYELEPITGRFFEVRRGLMYGGIGMALLGAGLSGYGLYQRYHVDNQTTVFTKMNEPSGPIPSIDLRDSSRNLTFPIGLAVAGLGLGTSLGIGLMGDDSEAPWLPVVIGTVLGAGLFGLSWGLQ